MPLDNLARNWDVVVVGAGVAGAAAALRSARAGLRVLLVEKSRWPRDKACGGCLNAAALREFERLGVRRVAESSGIPYAAMRLAARGREAAFPLPRGLAVARRRLDAALAECAAAAGARFVTETRASLGSTDTVAREVLLRRGACEITVRAVLVLDCGGLAGRLSRQATAGDLEVAPDAYIGVGTSVQAAPPFYRSGTIHMACGRRGYVGLVDAGGERCNVGAALDPSWAKRTGGPAAAISAILAEAGFPRFDALREARWHGTPRLTCRRRRLGSERVFILGDAAGYVEPFTGEGMAWALADAAAVAPLVEAAIVDWRDDLVTEWSAERKAANRARRRVCRDVSRFLRHPGWLAAGLPLVAAAPMTVAPLTARLNRGLKPDAPVNP